MIGDVFQKSASILLELEHSWKVTMRIALGLSVGKELSHFRNMLIKCQAEDYLPPFIRQDKPNHRIIGRAVKIQTEIPKYCNDYIACYFLFTI